LGCFRWGFYLSIPWGIFLSAIGMKLTRDFCALPAEYMLIPNLNNLLYVDLVLGSLERLPEKLAEAGKTSGSYSAWCKRQQPQHTGRLPTKTIRRETFIEDLVGLFEL